jgi:carbohydrate diacid regulator
MNISKTAKKLYLHRNTITYHLNKIKETTGLDPFNFHDLVKLMKLAEEL